MKAKHVVLFAVMPALILLSAAITGSQPPPKEHPLHIRKVHNKWKVVDSQDSTKSLVKTKKGENIVWKALGTDVYLQFPDSTLFGTESETITSGKTLRLRVLPTAQSGRYPYAVFCVTGKAYATGDSPPVIIVE